MDSKSASVQVPSWPLAAGFFSHANIIDTGSLTTRRAGSVTSATSSNSSILSVLDRSDVPTEFSSLFPSQNEVFVKGLTPGSAELRIEAEFTDGSKRSAAADLRTVAVEAVSIEPICDGQADLPRTTFVGATYSFKVLLKGGGQQLSGYQPDAVQGTGISCQPSNKELGLNDSTVCLWRVPSTGGALALSSRYDAKFNASLDTYAGAEITGIRADQTTGAFAAVPAPGGRGTIGSYITVAGGRPCQTLPVQVKTTTPTVCTGPGGATSWSSDAVGVLAYQAVAVGECLLTLGVTGSDYTETVRLVIPNPSR